MGLCTVSVSFILGENRPCMAISSVYTGKHRAESSQVFSVYVFVCVCVCVITIAGVSQLLIYYLFGYQ